MKERKEYLEKALNWVKKRSTVSIKSIDEEFEDPASFKNRDSEEIIQPELSFVTTNGAKHYTEIALKEDNHDHLVTRWKLLSTIAAVKRGKLHLLAPKGHKAFTERIVRKHRIQAQIASL